MRHERLMAFLPQYIISVHLPGDRCILDELEEGDLPNMDSFFDGRTSVNLQSIIDSSDPRPISTTCGTLT